MRAPIDGPGIHELMFQFCASMFASKMCFSRCAIVEQWDDSRPIVSGFFWALVPGARS